MSKAIHEGSWEDIPGEGDYSKYFAKVAPLLPSPSTVAFIGDETGRHLSCFVSKLTRDITVHAITQQKESEYRKLCYNLIKVGARLRCVTNCGSPQKQARKFGALSFVFIAYKHYDPIIFELYRGKLAKGGVIAGITSPSDEEVLYSEDGNWYLEESFPVEGSIK